MKPKKPHSNVILNTSTEIFGQKVVEAYRNLVRENGEDKRPGIDLTPEQIKANREALRKAVEKDRATRTRPPFSDATTNDMSNQHAVRRQRSSTEIFGQKVVEAYRNLVRKDEARMSDRDIDRQKRMGSGAYDDRTDRDADMPTAGARRTAQSIRRKAGRARAKYIRQTRDFYGSQQP